MIYIFLALIALACIAVALYSSLKKGELEARISVLEEDISERDEELARLEKIRHIPDVIERARKTKEVIEAQLEQAQRKADDIVSKATVEAHDTRKRSSTEAEAATSKAREAVELAERQAANLLEEAQKQAKGIAKQARNDAKEKTQKVDETLDRATTYALQIRQKAEKRAEEIAGQAYEARKRHEFYQASAQAMKNVVEGYADSYLVPSSHILDELAEEYGFHKMGEKLKLARQRTRIMEQNGTAATCGYPDGWKRDHALKFVLGTFNGKVDSILARVKPANQGKLIQEIKDAFALTNQDGEVYRDAKIQVEYLDARLEELKWAVAVQRLKDRQREEQRALRERIREEEKARKEYERAIKQAQKEEEVIAKALEKVRREFEQASEEEKSKYEAQLQELNAKFREAEERNKRAISMAQQTKCGHVYIISNVGSFGEDIYKIGLTRRLEPTDRVRELSDASVPFPFDIHAMIYSEEAPALESTLHKRFLDFQMNKTNKRKEFFRVHIRDIKRAIVEMGLSAKWTLAAEAREYRESLALEEAMKTDAELKRKWSEEQTAFEDRQENDEIAEDLENVADEVGATD